MMKKHWKLLLLCVAIVTIMCALCFSLNAENYSGICGGEGDGSNITWSFDTDTGLLKFEGTGKMANYGPDGAFPSPWYDKYESQIRSVEIDRRGDNIYRLLRLLQMCKSCECRHTRGCDYLRRQCVFLLPES